VGRERRRGFSREAAKAAKGPPEEDSPAEARGRREGRAKRDTHPGGSTGGRIGLADGSDGGYTVPTKAVDMRVRSKLKPGRPGTRNLAEGYGDRLVCVRHRYDALKRREKVKAAGGRWDSERRVWHPAMEQVLQLGLDGRVVSVEPTAPP